MFSTLLSTKNMSSPTLSEFIEEHEELLKTLYTQVKLLNNRITFVKFCEFTYYHTY